MAVRISRGPVHPAQSCDNRWLWRRRHRLGHRNRGPKKKLVGVAPFEPAEIQDLGDVVPKLLELKAKSKVPIQFQVRIEVGDGTDLPPASLAEQVNKILASVKDGFRVQ